MRPVVLVDAKKETRRGKTMNKNLENKPVAHTTGANPCFRSTKRFTFAILQLFLLFPFHEAYFFVNGSCDLQLFSNTQRLRLKHRQRRTSPSSDSSNGGPSGNPFKRSYSPFLLLRSTTTEPSNQHSATRLTSSTNKT